VLPLMSSNEVLIHKLLEQLKPDQKLILLDNLLQVFVNAVHTLSDLCIQFKSMADFSSISAVYVNF